MVSMVDSMLVRSLLQSILLLLILKKQNVDNTRKELAIVSIIKINFIGGGYCNFLHPKHVSRDLKKQLFKQMYDDHPDYREQRRE